MSEDDRIRLILLLGLPVAAHFLLRGLDDFAAGEPVAAWLSDVAIGVVAFGLVADMEYRRIVHGVPRRADAERASLWLGVLGFGLLLLVGGWSFLRGYGRSTWRAPLTVGGVGFLYAALELYGDLDEGDGSESDDGENGDDGGESDAVGSVDDSARR